MMIPYGIHDYKTIKTGGYLFVDKTEFIEKIEIVGKYLVFLRPRRFGKSLFTSMLYYYYDISSQEIFQDLFHDTYIGMKKTEEANRYYVLKFDFSGINTNKELIERTFTYTVRDYLQSFISYYKLDIKLDTSIMDAGTILKSFLSQFYAITNRQIYLLIDEYDHFANNVMTTDINLFNEITGKDGFVRSFYEVFKTYAGTVIGRMFITGVTPITLDSLTSGFNLAKNVTKHDLLSEMMGFTEAEVLDIIKEFDDAEKHLSVLKENYNGYLFNKHTDVRVYNSNMVLYYLDSLVLCGRPPDNLTDPNIVSDYTKITAMFDLYKEAEDKKTIIHNILKDELIETEIVDRFSTRLGFNRRDFLSLSYYLGLLTIGSSYGEEVGLKTPNYIIKNVYFEYYYHYLNEELNVHMDVWHIKDAVKELSRHNNPKPLIDLVEKFLNEISNRDFIKFDEKYIKLLMITYVRLSGLYLVKSEYPVDRYYIDIALLPNYVYIMENYFIFELKYIKIRDHSEKLLNEIRNAAIEQINKYSDNDEIRHIKNLRKYILIFVGHECKLIEEIIEDII